MLHVRQVAGARQHHDASMGERAGGPARQPRVDEAVVAAEDDQGRRGDPGRVPPGRPRVHVLRGQRPHRADQHGLAVAEAIPADEFGHLDGEPLGREARGVAEAGRDDVGDAVFRRRDAELAEQPVPDHRDAQHGEAQQVQPGPRVRQGRGHQRQRPDQVRSAGGDLHADAAPEGVADQVDRAAAQRADQHRDGLRERGDRVLMVGAGRGVAEAGQVHGLAGQPGPEQLHQVGPVAR